MHVVGREAERREALEPEVALAETVSAPLTPDNQQDLRGPQNLPFSVPGGGWRHSLR